MHIDDLMAYLDSLVGKEGREVSDEYIEPEDVLTFEYSSGEFGSLAYWETVKVFILMPLTSPPGSPHP